MFWPELSRKVASFEAAFVLYSVTKDAAGPRRGRLKVTGYEAKVIDPWNGFKTEFTTEFLRKTTTENSTIDISGYSSIKTKVVYLY